MLRNVRASKAVGQAQRWLRSSRTSSLQGMLTIPFILQVVAIVGLVGYLAHRNGQRSVADLTNQLMEAVSKQIEQKLTSYLESAQSVNQITSDSVRRGSLSLNFDPPNAQTEQYLWQQMQLFKTLSWISLGNEKGDSLGVWRPGEGQNLQFSMSNPSTQYFGTYYATSNQGRRTTKLKVERPTFDPRTRPWYKAAIAAKRAIWTPIYAGFTPGTVFIAASQPLYSQSGTLLGAVGTDISLQGIQDFLVKNSVSASGGVFLIERSGMLVASSSQEKPFRLTAEKSPQRVNVLDSQTPSIRATAQSLLGQVKDFQSIQQPQKFYFTQNHQGEFVKVFPFSMKRGIDWLIVIVVPESDVMAQIYSGTRTTTLLCLGALMGVIVLNTFISRWLVKPIVEISQASRKIAQGDFDSQVHAPNIQELSTLVNSFTQMSQELQQSRQQLEDYSRSLEQKVGDRTQSLEQEIQRRAAAETALQAANEALQDLVYVDALTQIANRRQFDERIVQEWNRLKREQLPLSLILCDVDYFKQYNDSYGHQAGDDCLYNIAQTLAKAVRRPPDLAARYGGEEFVLLLPNTSLEGAKDVAKKIQTHIQALELPHPKSAVSQYVTASFGVTSVIPTESIMPEQLLLKADRALYQAKAQGRDRIIVD